MKLIEDLRKEQDVDVIFEEINIRRNLGQSMVGTLYPQIVADEIAELNRRAEELRRAEPKQVIVMRKDLNMRKGKMIAQGAHASMAVLLHMMDKEEHTHFDGVTPITRYTLDADGYVREWLRKRFTKITVSVNSEAGLLEVYNKAQAEGIPSALITDSGLTEFGGVPTNTCCAIGPWRREDIDEITGALPLL